MKLLFLFVVICANQTSSYRMMLESNEKGRFIYKDDSGKQSYCTACPTGTSDEQNRNTQNAECIIKNFREDMPNNDPRPFCKEEARGGIIPGCGPLPVSGGLSWSTKSGRPIQGNSTVYEVYILECPSTSELGIVSIRCGENLEWNKDPAEIKCSYGCGLLPTEGGLTWLENGSEAGNYSLPGNMYVPKCPLGQRASATFYCGENSTWTTDPSSAVCIAIKPHSEEVWQCSDSCIIGICTGLPIIVLLSIVLGVGIHCTRRKKIPVPSDSIEMTYTSTTESPHSQGDFSPMKLVAGEST